jgi:hypothetical protein
MTYRVSLVLVFVLIMGARSGELSACGDKFMLVGRGILFQHAYAAIYTGAILIVQPPKAVKSAAVRDSRLVTALKMAGHKVDIVQQPANLADVLRRSTYDIVLAERADASSIPDVAIEGRQKATIVAVLEDPAPADLAAARQQFEVVLKAPDRLSRILNLFDDVMKMRREESRKTATTSGD